MTDLLDSPDAGPAAIRGGAVRVAGYAAAVVLSVGSAALLFRHLGVQDGGRYVLVLSVVTIAVGITEAGLSALGVREVVQRRPEEKPALMRALLGLRLLLSGGGVAAACAYALIAGFDDELVLGTLIAGVATLIGSVQAILTVVLQAELRFVAVTVAEFVRSLANTLAIVALVLAGAGLMSFFAALVVASVCGLVACVILLGRSVPLRPSYDPARWKPLLSQTISFALATAIFVVYLRLGLLLLDRLADATQTGLYAISFRVVEVVTQVPTLVLSAAFPIFARAARDDASRLQYGVQRAFDASFMLGGLAFVGFAAGAAAVIEVIGGEEFHAADPVLRWHALALWGTFAFQPFGFALLAIGRTRAILTMTMVGFVVALGATIPLASEYGAEGAAAAAAAAEWAMAITGALLLATGGLRVGFGTAAKVIAAAGAGLLPLLVLPSALAALAGMVIFAALVWLLRAVPEELLHAFRRS